MKIQKIAPAAAICAALLTGIWGLTGLSANAQQASITPIPASTEVEVGEVFEVILAVDPSGQPLAVADLHLRFDPAYLEVILVETLNPAGFNVLTPAFNNSVGSLDITAFQLGDDNDVPAFEPVRVKFRALAETPHTAVSHPQDVFPRTILAFAGNELAALLQPVDVIITGSGALSTLQADANGLVLGVWPNPANDVSLATFSVDRGGVATLELFDASGKVLQRLFHGATAPGIEQRVQINISHLADGIYFCRLITTEGNLVKRLAVAR